MCLVSLLVESLVLGHLILRIDHSARWSESELQMSSSEGLSATPVDAAGDDSEV